MTDEPTRSVIPAERKRPTTVPCSSPSDRYISGVWGTRLRHAALAVLIGARGRPVSLQTIWAEISVRHIVQKGLDRKDLADALRHECRRGRARRVERGVYALGVIAPRTRRRILAHERELRGDDLDTLVRKHLHDSAVHNEPGNTDEP